MSLDTKITLQINQYSSCSSFR